jgi:plasmid stabilization system protein ParE
MLGIDTSPLAETDLLDHYIYLYDEAGAAVANRFLDNAEKSFALLATHAEILALIRNVHSNAHQTARTPRPMRVDETLSRRAAWLCNR